MLKLAGRLLITAIVLGVLYTLAVQVIPGVLEPRFNKVYVQPPYEVSDKAKDLHQSLLVADMHADSLLWSRDLLKHSDYGQMDVPRMIEGNVGLQGFTIVTKSPRGQNIDSNSADTDRITDLVIASGWPVRTWGSLFERAQYQIDLLHEFEQKSGGTLSIIKTRADLEAWLASYRPGDPNVAGWLGIEGAHPLEGDIENLDRLYDAGLRMAGITHFFDNELGGSAHGLSHGGLTGFGRVAVSRMQQLGIVVDLAHASAAVIDDVLEMSHKPVVVSHAGVRGTCDNNRNLTDAQIRGIAGTGGVIAIGYWEIATCGRDAAAIARAIRYVVDLVGVDHVALGSDFDGSVVTPFDASGMGLITEALLAAGFSEKEIQYISGQNVVRVLRETLPQ